jgi:glycine/D-amino acid oxidase-like deaminating enzyme
VIVGAGICGLSAAWALVSEPPASFDVTVVADSFTPLTTSGMNFPLSFMGNRGLMG